MVSYLKTFTYKECKIAVQKKVCFWANFARIRSLYNKDEEVIQQRSGGYTTRIRRLYNKDQEVISRTFFGISATIRIGQEILCLPIFCLVVGCLEEEQKPVLISAHSPP